MAKDYAGYSLEMERKGNASYRQWKDDALQEGRGGGLATKTRGKGEIVSGVYKITNLVNRKVYIGISGDMERRFYSHRITIKKMTHPSFKDNDCHDINNFSFEILEYLPTTDLGKRETHYIDMHDSCNPEKGYNKARSMVWAKRVKKMCIKPTVIIPMLTPNDMLLRFGIDQLKLKKLIKEGMPCLRHKRLIRFDEEKVIQWFEEKSKD